MSQANQSNEALIQWLRQAETRLQQLIDPESPVEPQQRLQDLLDMSQRFLGLSQGFLELGRKASQAAQRVMDAGGGAEPGGG